MKKALSVVLALVMCLAFSLSVAAAPGSFVSSPSGNQAPQLIEGKNESEDCEAGIVITPYSERDTLSEEKRELMENVYDMIVEAADVGDLNGAIETLAKNKGISVESLAISDLFDISYYGCDDHDDHGYFRIKFKAETLKNFVALLHYNNNKWEIVEGTTVEDEVYLSFKADEFSPFAIVVNTGTDAGENQTGESFPWIYVVLMVVAAVGFVVVAYIFKKKKA